MREFAQECQGFKGRMRLSFEAYHVRAVRDFVSSPLRGT
jgi:hypothetical protein